LDSERRFGSPLSVSLGLRNRVQVGPPSLLMDVVGGAGDLVRPVLPAAGLEGTQRHAA
jgi:hypothetical protein